MIAALRANVAAVLGGLLALGMVGAVIALTVTRATLAGVRGTLAAERSAHRETVALHRIAAANAELDAARNVVRVVRAQDAISQEITDAYQTRLADARARADALRLSLGTAPADPGGADAAAVSGLSGAAGGIDGAAADRFSVAERLIATNQAIQLDALIAWVAAQAAVDPNEMVEEGR